MNRYRHVVFWMHLTAGTAGGVVILIMSVTGAALTYEKQLIERADRRSWSAPLPVDAGHLPPETLLAKVLEAQPGAAPTGITLRADPAAPATVTLEGNQTLLVDPYRAAIIGEPPAQPRAFFRSMTAWHRYVALEGTNRPIGKAISGAANLGFLFIVVSGLYLWCPKVWSALQFRNILWFRRGLSGKARDFSWHNVIGFWSCVPLAVVVGGAVPISYPWAGNLVYRIVGDRPPAPPPQPARPGGTGGGPAGRGSRAQDDRVRVVPLDGINAAWSRAEQQVADWRTITIRMAGPQAPLVFTIDAGYAGEPQKRGTLTVNRATAGVEKWETFDHLSAGRRLRSWLRFAHTGEIYGLTGQTVAGVASAGGGVLVCTGIALALRRFSAWIRRNRSAAYFDRRAA